MAKKRKRRRPAQRPAERPADASAPKAPRAETPASAARRDRKEEARQARIEAFRKMRRQRRARRGLVWGGGALAIGLVVFYFTNQSGGSGHLSKAAQALATRAGCSQVISEPDHGNKHLDQTGQPFDYSQYGQLPATSGTHDPTPLPQGIYSDPQPETQVVHDMEHGGVIVYYRQGGSDALPQDVVSALEGIADQSEVSMMPYPNLDAGRALDFASWDRLMQCPSTITADQATRLARAYIEGFKNAGNAPEAAATF